MNLRIEIKRLRRELNRLDVRAGSIDPEWLERETRWLATARVDQLLPPDHPRTWLLLGGRGSGKTTAAAQATATLVRTGRATRVAVVARTADDLRNISMVALQDAVGPGLTYFPSNHHKLVFPNGVIGHGFSATKPDGFRGFEFDLAWVDEAAAFRDADWFDQLTFALRRPGARLIVSTSPRPTKFIRELLGAPSTVVTPSRTGDNAANLDVATLASFAKYEGTRLGRQEVDGEVLDDLDGGLWDSTSIDGSRVTLAPEIVRTIVALDPSVGVGPNSDEVGIVVVGQGVDGQGYVRADLSGRMAPSSWLPLVARAARTWHAELVVVESNVGGDLIRVELQRIDQNLPVRSVHSTQSKLHRAKPIATLYELGRVHHVGRFEQLEEQLVTADLERGTGPDDRLDALVLGLTELKLGASPIDVPGIIDWQSGIWRCQCGHGYIWDPDRPCPNRCGRRAPATYPEPRGG